MEENNYKRWYISKSDSIFYRQGVFSITPWEKAQLKMMDGFIKFRKMRKEIGRGRQPLAK
jgi:hypothetical protein